MTDAPETIWAWPHDDKRGWYAGGCSTEVNLGMLGKQADEQFEYTRTDISQARVAELEGSLDRAEMNCQYLAQEVEARQARIAQLEAANDAAEQSGQNSDGGLWRFWADKSLELATQNAALQKENAALKAKP
jgi:hypothetical protein